MTIAVAHGKRVLIVFSLSFARRRIFVVHGLVGRVETGSIKGRARVRMRISGVLSSRVAIKGRLVQS